MTDRHKGLSIGDVANATGISVYTLRQWERRYGFPASRKLESGHRRYSLDEVSRLGLVAKALGSGFKASQVVALTYNQISTLLEGHQTFHHEDLVVEHWLKCVKTWESSKLMEYFNKDWSILGPIGFVAERVAPCLKRMGEAWVHGEISISQEHFFTELLQSFLSKYWLVESDENSSDAFVLAALEGESHDLGLHMCAVVLAAAKKKIIFLGTPTPAEEIVASAQANPVKAVCLSFSSLYPIDQAIPLVEKIYAGLPKSIDIIVGGDGAPRGLAYLKQFSKIRHFYDWLQYERTASQS
ncbi:MAG: MerR family transcriptional regulator [Bdellovibrionales bacterium]|nr:MerR family transcriptional regulator [Bdellovibrionales bacterium]